MLSHRLDCLPTAEQALPGRNHAEVVSNCHALKGVAIQPPFPAGLVQAIFALGCFWGAERRFWQQPGVYTTAVGYTAGHTPNPTYREVCSGLTGHTEAVLVVFDPQVIPYPALLRLFWESHNPTQGMRQGNDWGTQYRSGIYCVDSAQLAAAQASKAQYQQALSDRGLGAITTEILPAGPFYYADDYHQQYLHKHPDGYCGLRGTGVELPV